MKKLGFIIAVVLCSLVFTTGAKAQSANDYFVGKWNVMTLGTPKGDAGAVMVLERKDGKLTGTLKSEGKDAVTFSRIEEKEKSITAYFASSGYDVYLFLEKKDEKNAVGSMMDMFDATASRAEQTEGSK